MICVIEVMDRCKTDINGKSKGITWIVYCDTASVTVKGALEKFAKVHNNIPDNIFRISGYYRQSVFDESSQHEITDKESP